MPGPARLFAALVPVIGSYLLFGVGVALSQPYYGGLYGGYHASTAAEGYQRGMADVVRSQGAKNLMDSEAAINAGVAQSQFIDNRTQATNAYWERKKIYKENTAQQRYEEEQHRKKVRSRNMLTALTPNDLNPTTGAIHWPMICQDKDYAQFRDPLNELFAKRAQYGELHTADYLEAKKVIKEFRAAITANKDVYPSAPLSQSLRFLLKLNRELDANFS